MDSIYLEFKIKKMELTDEKIAKLLNIHQSTFSRKKKGYTDFTRTEIQKMIDILNLSGEEVMIIFFDKKLAYTQEIDKGK